MLNSLWQYRGFIFSSIRNDLITRFSRSKLGAFWMIINPLAQVAIYAIILSNVLAAKLPGIDNKYAYAIYLMAGQLAWTLFNEIVSRSLMIFIENGNLIKKMRFPRITLPAILVGSCVTNNALLFVSMLGIFLLLGHSFSFALLWLFPLTVILAGFALGVGLLLGILNSFVRDLGQVVPIVLQILYWFTPIVYPEEIIPQKFHYLLSFNPLYHFTNAYQEVIIYGKLTDINGLSVICIITMLVLTLGLFIFRRASEELVDVL